MGFIEALMGHANKCFQVAKDKVMTSNVMNVLTLLEVLIKMAYVACAIQLMDGAMNLILIVSVTILSFLNTDINVHNAMRYSKIVKSVNFKRIFKIKIDFSQKKLENMKKNLNFYHV